MNDGCDHFQQLMLGALGTPLSSSQLGELQRHVEDCATCRAYQERLEADDRALSAFTEAMQPAIAGIETAVMETLQHEEPAPGFKRASRFWSRRMEWAVAAAVALGILVLVAHLLTPLSTSTVTLAETLESMRQKPWIHVVQTRYPGDEEGYEYWECFGARTRARKAPGGKITYANYAENVMYSYNPKANKIAISFTTDNYMIGPQWDPVRILSRAVERADAVGTEASRQTEIENGRPVERVRVDYGADTNRRSVTYIRDLARNVLLQTETIVLEGGKTSRYRTTFDYPDGGPEDIYALGVPQNAAAFDIRPEGPALALVDKVQERFERGFGDYRAVVLESWVDESGTSEPLAISVLWQKNDLKRSDVYHAFNFQDRPDAPGTLYARIRDNWPNLTISQVLEIVDDNALERRMLFDGQRTIRWTNDGGQWVQDEHRTDQFKILDAPLAHSLAGLVWSNLHWRLQMGSSQFKREVRLLPEDPNRPGLAGLQFVEFAAREDYWFDPSQDYMKVERVRKEEGRGIAARYAVDQSARTPDGQWYPSVIEMEFDTSGGTAPTTVSRREWRVLLDTHAIFDDSIFVSSGAGVAAEEAPAESSAAGAKPQDETESIAEVGLRGVVKDEQGQPVPEATVLVYHNRNRWGLGNRVVAHTRTDTDGRFWFESPVTFELTAQRAGLQDSYALLGTRPGYAFGWQQIRQGQERETYDITLTEPVSRTITVTDHNDLPLAGARVWLSDVGDRKSSNPLFRDDLRLPTDTGLVGGTAGSDGRAIIENLPATSCCFAATLAGYADGWAFSSQDRIRLSPGATVSGWVLTEAGDPVAKAVVRLYTQWYMHQYFLAETDSEGHFELRDLPARGWDMSPFGRSDGGSGHYKLTVEHEDYAGLPRELHLSPGETIDDLVVEMATETTLVRCLVLEEGTDMPVPGARIDGTNQIGSIEGESDATGVFTVRVLPGPVTLSFESPPDGVYILDQSSTDGRSIRFDAQGREMEVVVRSPVIAGPLVTASGTVCGPEGLPLEDAVVYADAGRFSTATTYGYVPPAGTDVNGRFTLDQVPAGLDLHVYAETKDHALAAAGVHRAPADANESTSIELILLPTDTAVTLVEDDEGHPVSSQSLSIYPVVEGATIWRAERTGRTDGAGLLQTDGMVPGLTYFLRDARFDTIVGPRPESSREWFQGKTMVLIPLEP
ncbi:MAG: carboxypeptidase regulatory-like domain-containing protein [Phycisphaerales bacterium]|nr:MAG: carboxypeptidase regulatory-like domain-containing protein [Phycisphaerales bacterium]